MTQIDKIVKVNYSNTSYYLHSQWRLIIFKLLTSTKSTRCSFPAVQIFIFQQFHLSAQLRLKENIRVRDNQTRQTSTHTSNFLASLLLMSRAIAVGSSEVIKPNDGWWSGQKGAGPPSFTACLLHPHSSCLPQLWWRTHIGIELCVTDDTAAACPSRQPLRVSCHKCPW